ncbi:hypothetical protein HHK36_024010 [Tetracentron sinense]|uniref:Uncharacterized protein n=1 Tax=Tetracentron sinense TaxID=13715 RepID=A0A834YU69_TETSI|nr:hypothetical protein HHK36_024010 [Tetracentron sinense]
MESEKLQHYATRVLAKRLLERFLFRHGRQNPIELSAKLCPVSTGSTFPRTQLPDYLAGGIEMQAATGGDVFRDVQRNAKEQLEIVDCIYKLQKMGIKGELKERTYSEPQKWMSGKGRVTIQFGCCYNFATDKNGNPLGILPEKERRNVQRRIQGKIVNILDGLELHISFLSAKEQLEIVDCIYKLQKMGIKGELKERTYSEPQKLKSGKGRVTIQFGCCYNFATDKNGNPIGILRNELVDPIPPLFKKRRKRLVEC